MSTPWVPTPGDNVVPIRPSVDDDGARPLGASDAVPVRSVPAGAPPVVAGSPVARGAGPREDSWRRGSATSFGLVGRLVITAILVAILVLIALGNLLGVPVYLAFMAWALRDLWVRPRRRAPSRTVARHAGAEDAAWSRAQRPIVPRDGE